MSRTFDEHPISGSAPAEPQAKIPSHPNIVDWLAERAGTDPDRLAIVEYRRSRARGITLGELTRRVAALGQGMRAAGIEPGDRVLLFVPMSIDLYALLLGCLHAGATAVFVDAWADRRRLDAAVLAAQPKLFIGTPKAHLLRALSASVRRIPVHWIAGRRWLTAARYEQPGRPDPPARVSPDAPALITFTTGSTGHPKAAARSHAFLWSQHEALAAHLRFGPEDVDMPTLPIFVLNNLAQGVTSVLPDFDPRYPGKIDPERVVRQIRAEGVTTSSGSPAFYARLADWCEASGERLPLRAVWTGGAPVYPPLARRLSRMLAGTAHVVYGSTEAEPIAGIGAEEMLAVMEASDGMGTPGGTETGGICVGKPAAEVKVRLIRPHDGAVELADGGWVEWEVGSGEVGEVVVTGRHVLGEYLDAPEETRRHKIRDGDHVWHRTGDAARFDTEGRLWLMGRVGERVVRAGETWWSAPVEVAALCTPGVTHAAYLGVDDPDLGQRAILCVEAARSRLDASDLQRIRSAIHPTPVDELRVLRHIPRDPRHASKTNLSALRRRLVGRGAHILTRASPGR